MTEQEALNRLAEVEGMEVMEMLEKATCVAPAICIECGYTASMEPDQAQGYCEGCGKNAVQSCLSLAGII